VSDLAADGGDAELAYVRVAADIESEIASGALQPGTRLRAERELAEHYGVAYGTMRRATKLLREKGLIVTIHGRGTFVAGK
jgi:GntR family transcriptional regulator